MTKQSSDMAETPFHLLIPAAGSGRRTGHDIPKQYRKINGKTVLRHTIEKFINIKGLKSVVVLINDAHRDLYNEAVQGLNNVSCKTGSNTRKNSIMNGLSVFSESSINDFVLIHDAARPLVRQSDIEKLLQSLHKTPAATLATPVTDTLYRADDPIDRDELMAIQTPQGFKICDIKQAHDKFKGDDSFTDDAGLMRAAGHDVKIIEADRQNMKITTEEDFQLVKQILTAQNQTRTASGYDVHAFEDDPTSDREFILGGIKIPHDLALKGHSDADVVLHAITDALLGTINAGDIGTHFPPSDDKWKDMNSAHFLKHAADLIRQRGGDITFIDVTIMAEAPKIGSHRAAMQKRIAEILNIDASIISIKATTTEGLGFTGRKEGIATQALATVTLPVTD